MHDPLERPTWACVLQRTPEEGRSWHKADDGFRTCSPCYSRFLDRLKDVGRRYLLLSPAPGATGDHGRGSPGFGSRSPASDHIIAMRDPRSKSYETSTDGTQYVWDPHADTTLEAGQHGPPAGAYVEKREVWWGADGRGHTEQSNPPRSVPAVLASVAALIAEERDVPPSQSRDVHELLRWINRHTDWLSRHELIADVDLIARELVSQLRPATGEPGRKDVGKCPNTVDEGDTTRECRAILRAPLKGDVIECRECGRKWYRPEWEELGRLLQAETLRPAS